MIPIDDELVREQLAGAAQRFVRLIRDAPDPTATIPSSTWTLQEVVVHVIASLRDYGESLAGVRPLRTPDRALGPTNVQIRTVNAQRMAEIDPAGLNEGAALVIDTIESFLLHTEGQHGATPYDWYGKRESTLSAMTGIMLGELLIHGLDVARALRRPWRITRPEALSILTGAFTLLPAYVDQQQAASVVASFEVALRRGPSIGIVIEHGMASVEYPARAPFDCRLNVDPVAMLLVSYGRTAMTSQVLRGRLLAWGRRPWLGLRLPQLILRP